MPGVKTPDLYLQGFGMDSGGQHREGLFFFFFPDLKEGDTLDRSQTKGSVRMATGK